MATILLVDEVLYATKSWTLVVGLHDYSFVNPNPLVLELLTHPRFMLVELSSCEG